MGGGVAALVVAVGRDGADVEPVVGAEPGGVGVGVSVRVLGTGVTVLMGVDQITVIVAQISLTGGRTVASSAITSATI